jgi:signal recognition particle subunit SRP19
LEEIAANDDNDSEEEEDSDEAPDLLVPQSASGAQPQSGWPTGTSRNPQSAEGIDYKNWICVYPIYIDAKRPYRPNQRRIAREKSVWWPTSYLIASAVQELRVSSVHEPTRTHPRDWENPGRVKIQLKMNGRIMNQSIKTKKQLLEAIAAVIQRTNPTQKPLPEDFAAKADDKEDPHVQDEPTKFGSGRKIRKRTPLPQPPEPLPSLSQRLSPRSPLIESGVLIDALKAATGSQKGIAGKEAGPSAGKGKRKIVRVRG